ncbi:hypothetical protein Pflav_052970 [Phytohabitans flavus]|uniref:3'-5' exoribonuclease Rv2179c-like domain-containing protein n=1 Tax=Phytohabitans flavus TaxID=1076124 RepID=A0A6F8XYK5_9ACTN|nr:hypothetical protein Pflav_052970 [Phytohabitans flavus]
MMAPMVYRYFYDCEFIEDGQVVDLVSIGVVDEYGREFYAISTEFDDTKAVPWVRRNVLDRLPSPGDPAWRSRERIRDDLYQFLIEPIKGRPHERMELWAWYAAYDHVALAQLWGRCRRCPGRFRASRRISASAGTTAAGPRCRTPRPTATTPSWTPVTTSRAGGRWAEPGHPEFRMGDYSQH